MKKSDDTTEEAKKSARNVVSSDEESKGESLGGNKIATKRKARASVRRSSISSVQSHEKHYVEHNYHDHLCDPVDQIGGPAALIEDPTSVTSSSATTIIKKQRRGHRGGVAVPFPDKLHYMLSKMDEEETADIVSWQPHGRCFTVHKPKEFVSEIMPR